jgi:hypothetical protein
MDDYIDDDDQCQLAFQRSPVEQSMSLCGP